jgi:hypothetical protein
MIQQGMGMSMRELEGELEGADVCNLIFDASVA